MTEIPIVQGTIVTPPKVTPPTNNTNVAYNTAENGAYIPPVPVPIGGASTNGTGGDGTFSGSKGESQPKKYQDAGFAVAFLVHIVAIFVCLGMYGGSLMVEEGGGDNNGGGGSTVSSSIVSVVVVSGVFSLGLSAVSLGFMMKYSTQLVKTALIFSVSLSGLVAILGFMSGQMMMGILGGVSFAVGCCYAYFVWERIPFAAANLNTALTAVKQNMGLSAAAYFFLVVAFGWSVVWSLAAGGTMNALGSGSLFVFLVSFYWTHQVIQNTVHVTTAGTIGTWWFAPNEASSCCSQGLKDSFLRATTYSFGSICFGSLLVAIVQALRQINNMARDQDDCNMLVCIIDCILGCLESILEYLNKWAYVYVGLYGYGYLEAGKNVMTLFANKGWTTIITDDLVDNVLFMISVAIGLTTGLVGLIIAEIEKASFQAMEIENPGMVGFTIGLIVGYLLGSILMSVVGSAVNTVIVCFAESPNEFAVNHPELSNEMRTAWRQAWPVECGEY